MLLIPTSIAVIGASHEPGKVGHEIFKNLMTQGYTGKVFPVNPKGGSLLDREVFTSIKDLPKDIDLAVIVTPAKTVPGILEECGVKGIKHIVVISAGFGEVHTKEGDALEKEVKSIAKKHGMQLIGPNCLGIIRPSLNMNASFATAVPPAGGIALISQSGAAAVALMDGAENIGLEFSTVLSIGNKTVFDESDALRLCAEDPETKVIGLYLESIQNGRKFLREAASIQKPIVLLKAGVSEFGKKAAASHTGALAGMDSGIQALCTQAGIARAKSLEEFTDLLLALSQEPPLLSPQIAIITNAGGPGILAADAAAAAGLQLPTLEQAQQDALKSKLPPAAAIGNPIDVVGDADADRFRAALEACAKDKNIDGVCVLLTPQIMTPVDEIANEIAERMKKSPLMPVVTSFIGHEHVGKARKILQKAGIPTYDTPERAVRALAALQKKSRSSDSRARLPDGQVAAPKGEKDRGPTSGAERVLLEPDIQRMFASYNIPLPKQEIATSAKEATEIAERIGYPVIAKINSPDILHKTDVGGIRGNLNTATEVSTAYEDILKSAKQAKPNARIEGVLIQEFVPAGHEFIIGLTRDPSFGHLIMVGLGGIYTELFRDTAFRIAPIDEKEAFGMLSELKGWKLLLGMRGEAEADIATFADLLSRVSKLATDHPEIKELDLNPVLVSRRIIVADAKIITL